MKTREKGPTSTISESENIPVFTRWKTQYYEDTNSPQIELHMENNPNSNSTRLLVGNDKPVVQFIGNIRI